jgi:oxygen-independent coproporphyrinogen III oxidase
MVPPGGSRVSSSLERILDLAHRLDTRGPRYTSYPTVPAWRGLEPAARAEALDALAQRGRPIAVYLHLPFCARRCLYCGCNSFISSRHERMQRYVDALAAEVQGVAGRFTHEHLHLGGGTPTQLPPPMLAALLDGVFDALPGAADVERSVEVDPRVTRDEHLALLSERGFRRISIGVQDLDLAVQEAIARVQPFALVRDFVARSRAHGFTSINLDLIYGLPMQSLATWRATLEQILELLPDRLACFGYAHLPERIKHQRALPMQTAPNAEQRIEMLVEANAFFRGAGYEAIGFDHFAHPDDELARAHRNGRLQRNFMGYTTTRGLEMLGFGCSAISELDAAFWQNEVHPERYAERIEAGKSPTVRGHLLDADDRYRKALIGDLMCNLSVRPVAASEATGLPPPDDLVEGLTALGALTREGLVDRSPDGFRVTGMGQLFLRNLAMPFDRYLCAQDAALFSRTV